MTNIQTVDREMFHQMMRRLSYDGPPREEITESMRHRIGDLARRLADATAAKVGGNVSIAIDGSL